jgi:hypothetical protein
MKYAEVNDSFSGNRSTTAKLFGLKKTVSIDFDVPIICFTLTGSSWSTASQEPDRCVFQGIHDSSPVQNDFQFRRFSARSSALSSFPPSIHLTF